MRRGAALLSVLALAASLSACGSGRTGKVNDYVKAANAIQDRAAPEFARADAAYQSFSAAKLSKEALADVSRAEDAIRATREQLAKLHPPADADRLHRLLLRVFDLNLGLAHETTQMALYLPDATAATKPLAEINQRLQKGLGTGGDTPRQTKALGRYRGDLVTVIDALRKLDPPPLLAGLHMDQITRLEDTFELAGRLKSALRAADQARVTDLLVRFRDLNSETGTGIEKDAIAAYSERVANISRASEDVQREQNRLSISLR